MRKAVVYIRSIASKSPAQQRDRIDRYLKSHKIQVLEEFVERAGAKKSFPALQRALTRADGRLLVVSNLGQMVKSPRFMRLLEQSQNFVALDEPLVRPDTMDQLLRAAEDLTRATRTRIKASLEELKKQGVPLGSAMPGHDAGTKALLKHRGKGPKAAAKQRTQRAADYYQFVMPKIVELRRTGASHNTIANTLNDEGFIMQNGKPYHQVSVYRLQKRWEKVNGKIAPKFDQPGRTPQCS